MQTVVITGASAGVGRATAREFARRGAALALLARGSAGLAGVAAEVRELGARALPLEVDVADPERVREAAAQIELELGPIDVWINNAMVTVFGPVARLTAAEIRRVTDVTYLGAVWGTMAALDRMRTRDQGVVVQVGSALAYRAIPLQEPYCAAKHALRAFTDSVRSELLHDHSRVRICSVHLPALDTPQFLWGRSHMDRQAQPVPPIYRPEVAARAIVAAADGARRETFVCWPTVRAVIGNRFLPGWLDRYLADAAWGGQMTDAPVEPGRADNLETPVDVDHGAHGRFCDRERDASWLDRASTRLGAGTVQTILLVLVAAVLVGVLALLAELS